MFIRWVGSLVCMMAVVTEAQSQVSGDFASTDQRVYISGEQIWLFGKLFGSQNIEREELQVYLFDRNAAVVSKHKILAKDGQFLAGIQIKETTASDNYVIGVSRGNVFTAFLPVMIINPVIPPGKSETVPRAHDASPRPAVKALDIQINGEEKKSREKVDVKVSNTSLPAAFFAVVHKDDALSVFADSLFSNWAFEYKPDPVQQDLTRTGWSFEAKALKEEGFTGVMRIKARAVNAAGKPVPDLPIITSLLGSQSDLGYTSTNAQGEMEAIHPFHYANPSLVVTPLGDNAGVKIILEDNKDSYPFQFKLPALQLRADFETAMNERVTNASASTAFAPERKLQLITADLDTTDFYGVPDKRYVLDDYKRFPDMQEILQEFVTEVRVKKVSGQTVLQVVNLPYKTFFEQGALVLLDGVPVLDIDQLLALDPLKIYAIEVVGRKFFLGHLQVQGIVHYKTYKSDLAGYKLSSNQLIFDYSGLDLPRIPAYAQKWDARLPDIRNTIFMAQPGDIREGHFQFSTLDVLGKYAIKVIAVDANGNIHKGEKEIIIK